MTGARAQLPLALLHVAAQVAFGLLGARAWLVHRNSLERSGHWIATKTTLERGVMGAFNFMRGGQATAQSRLNLGAWFGYQEVIYKRPLRLREIEFDFQLGQKAYACVLFAKTAAGFSGIRLSSSERFPSQLFEASDAGEFLRRTAIQLPALPPRSWHRALVGFSPGELTLAIDGRRVKSLAASFPEEQVVGFRGGRRMALVDNVVFREQTGDASRPVSTVHESFGPADFLAAGGIAVAILLCLNGLAFALLRSRGRSQAALATLLANGVGAALCALLLGYQALAASRYPGLDQALHAREELWKIAAAEDVRAEIARRYAGRPHPARVLFLGTSQTWGAGAARAGETFVAQLERRLTADLGRPVECVNGGISAVDSGYLLGAFESDWAALGAKAVVLDLGNNDGDAERLGANLPRLIRAARAAGARPLVVLEPNSSEDPGADLDALRARHAVMRRVAEAEGVPVTDMHEHLARNEDRGFLWWDSVHLTSFGQRLFAERLAPELLSLLRASPE